MKTKVISLPDASNRRMQICDRFENLLPEPLEFWRAEGVSPFSEQIAPFCSQMQGSHGLRPAELCCLLSWRSLLHDFLSSEDPYWLILEDDAEPLENFDLSKVTIPTDDWDFIQLHRTSGEHRFDSEFEGLEILRPTSMCSVSFLVSRQGAEKFLACQNVKQVDLIIMEISHADGRSYGLVEPMINHDTGFESQIFPKEDSSLPTVYSYWTGDQPLLIHLCLRIAAQKAKEHGFRFKLIRDYELSDFIDLPENWEELWPTHKADMLRVSTLFRHGGIWMDADSLITGDVSSLLDATQEHDGAFYFQENGDISIGTLVSRPGTEAYKDWMQKQRQAIAGKSMGQLEWNELGSDALREVDVSQYVGIPTRKTTCPIPWVEWGRFFGSGEFADYDFSYPIISLFKPVYEKCEEKGRDEVFSTGVLGELLTKHYND